MSNLVKKFSKLLVAVMVVLSVNVSPLVENVTDTNNKIYAATAKVKKKTYEGFIDRMSFPKYARDLYESLYDNSQDMGGYLINEKKVDRVESGSYVHKITTEKGTISASMGGSFDNIIAMKVSKSDVPENVYQVYFAFYLDHPEVFWIKQAPKLKYSYSVNYNPKTKSYNYEIFYYIVIKDVYANYDIRDTKKYKTASDIIKAMNKRDTLVKSISKKVLKKDVYSTVSALNKYLVSKNEYNTLVLAGLKEESLYTHQAMCALEGNKGKKGPICMAYASAFKLICDNLGIPCISVCGDATTAKGVTGGHEWNSVKLDDGKWYAIDVTWNDTGHVPGAYLCVGTDTKIAEVAFKKSHKMTNKGYSIYKGFTNQPVLSKRKYNYSGYRVVLDSSVYTYNGKKIKPAVKVYEKKKLVKKKFYKVKYKNNKKCGRAEVTVSFKGKYKKVKARKAYFAIAPKAASIKAIMPFKKSAYITIKAVSGVSGYEIKYSKNKTFSRASSCMKSIGGSETDVLIEGLESGKTYHFKIRTYVEKNGKRYYSDYSNISGVVIN